MASHASLFTNNEWKKGSGPSFSSYNPATQELVWEGSATTPEEVDEAIKNARKAFQDWADLTIDERSQYVNRYSDFLQQNPQELSEIISKEVGKPLWESRAEVESIINKVAISFEAYGRRCAGMIRDLPIGRSITRHFPHGVVAIFGPFNFPGHLPQGHIIPALLAGNTVVFKPSEFSPLVGEILIKTWEKCQLPPGVINLVQGGPETGKALLQHPDINGVFFTGSYRTGKILLETLGTQPEKILALEMGGNNPFVVSDISDFETAAYLTIQSAYLSSGQRCTCARRLIVVKGEKGEKFIQVLVELIQRITVGPYTDVPEPYMGPIINEYHAKQILEAQTRLASLGGISLIEMKHLKPGTGFLSPGLMDVTPVINRPDEEIFGPFLQLIWVNDFEEALQEANRTQYGLAAGLLSNQQEEYNLFYRRVRAGIMNWNTQLTGAISGAPFGGIKHSGNHRPSAYYAADYCSYPIASIELPQMKAPSVWPPGIKLNQAEQ